MTLALSWRAQQYAMKRFKAIVEIDGFETEAEAQDAALLMGQKLTDEIKLYTPAKEIN